MAALFCDTRRIELHVPPLQNIEDWKAEISAHLKHLGFQDVVNTPKEVAGNRGDVRLSVLHLLIGGLSFFELVMAGGEAGDVTLGAVNEVVNAIKNQPDTL
jgi:hypothetical protein